MLLAGNKEPHLNLETLNLLCAVERRALGSRPRLRVEMRRTESHTHTHRWWGGGFLNFVVPSTGCFHSQSDIFFSVFFFFLSTLLPLPASREARKRKPPTRRRARILPARSHSRTCLLTRTSDRGASCRRDFFCPHFFFFLFLFYDGSLWQRAAAN